MDTLDRRNLFAAFSALAAMAGTAQAAPRIGFQTTAQLSKSQVFKYAGIPVRTFPNGGTQRPILSGTLPTGEFIEITVAFRDGPGPNKEGTLQPGGSTRIKKDMIFDVTATDKS